MEKNKRRFKKLKEIIRQRRPPRLKKEAAKAQSKKNKNKK
jgi:hypothetical protein